MIAKEWQQFGENLHPWREKRYLFKLFGQVAHLRSSAESSADTALAEAHVLTKQPYCGCNLWQFKRLIGRRRHAWPKKQKRSDQSPTARKFPNDPSSTRNA